MAYKLIHNCPVCGGGLRVTKLLCPGCGTEIQGDFEAERLLSLSDTQRAFVVSFLRNRGNIREMEKELGISYPTVRARLDEIVQAIDNRPLGERVAAEAPEEGPKQPLTRKEILELLALGQLTPEEAKKLLTPAKD